MNLCSEIFRETQQNCCLLVFVEFVVLTLKTAKMTQLQENPCTADHPSMIYVVLKDTVLNASRPVVFFLYF